MGRQDVVAGESGGLPEEWPESHQVQIFADAAAVTLTRLDLLGRRKRFDAGQQIIRRGDDISEVMLLRKGLVKATLHSPQGREISIRRIRAGEIFGDYSAIDQQPRSADVYALTEVEVTVLPAREFVHLVTADPAVAYAQMRELVAMVRRLSGRIYQMTAYKASERLIACLLDLAQETAPNQAGIQFMPTHAELAALISSQRHVVTTELKALEKQGLMVRQDRYSVHLPDLAALRELQRLV